MTSRPRTSDGRKSCADAPRRRWIARPALGFLRDPSNLAVTGLRRHLIGVRMDEADAQIYRKYADELVRFATALAGPDLAEDILADAVLRVFSSPAWRGVRNRRAYLYRAVLNEATHAKRSIDRRLRREAAATGASPPPSHFEERELIDALRRLTVRQRAVVYLTYWIGIDATEIARGLAVSVRTVERELATARRRLEVLLR